jgi:hypothetical protein
MADPKVFESIWRARNNNMAPFIGAQLENVVGAIQVKSRMAMGRLIYSKPPDTKPDGTPKWYQTRKLYNAEQAVPTTKDRIRLINTMVYARARHELGRDGRRTTRNAHWRDEVRADLRATFAGAVRKGALRAWSGSRITAESSPGVRRSGEEGGMEGEAGGRGALTRPRKPKKPRITFPRAIVPRT